MNDDRRTGAAVPRAASARVDAAPSPLLIATTCLLIPAVLTYCMAAGSELQVFGAVIALCALVGCFSQPFAGLLIFLALLYIRPEESITALAGMHFTLIVAIVTLLGMLTRNSMDHVRLLRFPVLSMAAGLLATAAVSTLPSGDTMTAVEDIGRLVILVILIGNLVRTPRRYAVCVSALIGLSVYLAAFSIALFFSGSAVRQDGVLRSEATGIFSDPNDLAATIVPAIALLGARLSGSKSTLRPVYLLLGAILLTSVLFADSRGGMLALVATFAGFVLTGKASKTAKMTLLACSLLVFAGSGRMTNFDSQEASANSRFWFWDNGITQLMGHPLVGVGYGQFASVNGGMVAHNSFVQCFAEVGLIGYFFWIGAIYLSFRSAQVSSGAVAPGRALTGARIALAAYLVASFWLSHTYSPILFVLLCLPMAAQSEGSETLVRPARRADYAVVLGICFASIAVIKTLADHYK